MASELLSRGKGVLIREDGFVYIYEIDTESQSAPLFLGYHQV